jgi:uncharacterized surface protein with fasciclin (FAS1) repeats
MRHALAAGAVLPFLIVLAGCGGTDPAASPRSPTEVRAPSERPSATGSAAPERSSRSPSPSASPSLAEPSEMGSASPSEVALELPREGLPGSLTAMAQLPAASAAATNPLLTTLSAGIERADLAETLDGAGPFTVFAPTDAAFAAVPADDLDALLADRGLLGDVLTYHVVEGEALDRAMLVEVGHVETADGDEIVFGAADETLSLNGAQATIVMADIRVANGIIHLIDGVLSPEG